jgi:hypothetical protein
MWRNKKMTETKLVDFDSLPDDIKRQISTILNAPENKQRILDSNPKIVMNNEDLPKNVLNQINTVLNSKENFDEVKKALEKKDENRLSKLVEKHRPNRTSQKTIDTVKKGIHEFAGNPIVRVEK